MKKLPLRFPEYCWSIDNTVFNFRLFIHEDSEISYITDIINRNVEYGKKYNKEKYQKYKMEVELGIREKNVRNSDSDKKYYNKNKDKLLDYQRKYYSQNIESIKKYRKINKERRSKILKKWKERNPERVRVHELKCNNKRKDWGIEPINEYFDSAHFHHMHIDNNHSIGIYIPAYLHRSISHNYNNKNSMNEINKIATEWYFEETIMINKINIRMEEI